MVSFITISKDKKKREAYVKDYAVKQKIDQFDITIVDKENAKKATQSIGIEDIKAIQEKIFLKPIISKDKLIIIEDAQLLTPEAQNALLKVLEEPPANTIIMLCTETKETLLPTILSRCQIIELEEDIPQLSEKTIEELNIFIESLPNLSIADRLKQAEQLAKDKDKALIWIENLIMVLHGQMITNYTQNTNFSLPTSHFSLLKSFQSLHALLKTTNVNPRFAIEHTLLSL
jgi:replication-associated recombination protein RarA